MIRTEGVKVDRARRAWVLYEDEEPLCTVGIFDRALIGSRIELWFVLHEGFTKYRRNGLRFLKRGAKKILHNYKTLMVHVDSSSKTNLRFVRHLGFKYVTSLRTIDNRVFNVFEMRQ